MNLHESGLSSKNLFVGILTVITLCFGWVPLWAMDFDLSGDATADIRNEKDGSVFVNIKQKGEDVFNAGLQKIEKIPGAGKLKSLRTNESWHDRTMGFGEHKPNYFLPVSYSTFQGDRKEKEAKFQLSFKQGFFKMGGNVIFFAYTQKSFWQVFDLENSRPFRETNYNPELFFRSDIVTTDHLGSFALDFGYEHESNGAREPISRSWDRLYFIIKHKSDFLVLKYKYWYRLPEDPKVDPADTKGDENPDIHEYLGNGALSVAFNLERFQASLTGRYFNPTRRGMIQLDISWESRFFDDTYWYIQAFNGYGESLIDYNNSFSTVGLGFMFNR